MNIQNGFGFMQEEAFPAMNKMEYHDREKADLRFIGKNTSSKSLIGKQIRERIKRLVLNSFLEGNI